MMKYLYTNLTIALGKSKNVIMMQFFLVFPQSLLSLLSKISCVMPTRKTFSLYSINNLQLSFYNKCALVLWRYLIHEKWQVINSTVLSLKLLDDEINLGNKFLISMKELWRRINPELSNMTICKYFNFACLFRASLALKPKI